VDRELLANTMSVYVELEHDHSGNWLGSATWDRRALAGYVSLCNAERDGRLSMLRDDTLRRWVGAIVWFQPHDDDEAYERRERLLGLAAARCPEHARFALLTHCRGEVSRGRHVWALHHLTLPRSDAIAMTVGQLCRELVEALTPLPRQIEAQQADALVADDEIPAVIGVPESSSAVAAALDAWSLLTSYLVDADRGLFDEVLTTALAADKSTAAALLAAEMASLALRTNHKNSWSVLGERLDLPDFGVPVIARLADRGLPPQGIDVTSIEDLYRWASRLLPRADDVTTTDTHWVSDDENARRWRDSLLRVLVERASAEAVAALRRLSDEDHENLAVRSALVAADEEARFRAWVPPTAEELAELFVDPQRRLVRSDVDLLGVVIDTLGAIAAEIPGHAELLWNYVKGQPTIAEGVVDTEPWEPKLEAALQAYFAHELRLRLSSRGAVVNREVLVTPTNVQGAGTRSDILVEAVEPGRTSGSPKRSSTVIELKGAWNEDLLTGLHDQLVKEYLPNLSSSAGVYLVAWFALEHWTVDGSRRRKVPRRSALAVHSELSLQAAEIGAQQVASLAAFLIEIPRPHRMPPVQSSRPRRRAASDAATPT
jgi:hypothetical protein